jgi:hypothetical protein
MNKFLGIGILGVLALGAYKLFGMKQISDKVVTHLVKPRVHKVDLRGIVMRTEISIDNPTRFRMNITKPVITLTSDGKYITSTRPEQKSTEIKPMDTSTIDTIEIVIPWTAIAGYASDILTKIPELTEAWKKKDLGAFAKALSIPLEVKYSLYANGIFYQAEPEKIL